MRVTLNPFHEDLDRILFSEPFRRLAAKTQVHPLSDNDHVRTRLSHSMEASMIGLALGYKVGEKIIERRKLEEVTAHDFGALLQVACMAHDIGNPPFGHEGEQAMRDWYAANRQSFPAFASLSDNEWKDVSTFEGNAQGFRIVTQIENYRGNGGMQLTCATLSTFMKYPWSVNHALEDKVKFGFFQSEREYMQEVAQEIGLLSIQSDHWVRHPLAYLVEAADDICYSIIDIEDGIAIGSLTIAEVLQLFEKILDKSDGWKTEYKTVIKDDGQRISYLRAKIITQLVKEAVEVFLSNEDALLVGQFKGRSLLDEVPSNGLVNEAKQLAKQKVFYHEKKLYLEVAAHEIVSGLLNSFTQACLSPTAPQRSIDKKLLKLMGTCRPDDCITSYEKVMRVNDFVSGMTDRFALGMYRQIKGISHGGMTPAPR